MVSERQTQMMSQKGARLTAENAEALAADALAYLAGDMEHLGRFLALSGIGPAELREAAEEPGFLVGVLEFYMAHEPLLLSFCETRAIRPTLFAAARFALDGVTPQDG
ncbi:DUF3572 domain-containing protein [Stappia indica]|uniref:DUF3572 domain-containing protein n=1 Tax=Stappia indica TaxID=538381 RepID=UPI00296FCF96|nr:DUF3572 domain-containing protein [Stappia indica]